jgi:hypothetical protein
MNHSMFGFFFIATGTTPVLPFRLFTRWPEEKVFGKKRGASLVHTSAGAGRMQ